MANFLREPDERSEIEAAVSNALEKFASEQNTVVLYKPVINIQVNLASGGGATVNVRGT